MALTSPTLLLAAGLPTAPLGSTIREIQAWLYNEKKIQPVSFKTVVGEGGLGFEIRFQSEQEADRFLQRFASLVAERVYSDFRYTGKLQDPGTR